MKEIGAWIKYLKEEGELADAIGMFFIGIGGCFGVIMMSAIFG